MTNSPKRPNVVWGLSAMSPYLCASEGYDERDVARQCASGQGLGGAVLSVEQED